MSALGGALETEPGATAIVVQINENGGDEQGSWHVLVGCLEAKDDYAGAPKANTGVAAGGWFCLGDNKTPGSGHMTACGDYNVSASPTRSTTTATSRCPTGRWGAGTC